MTNVLLSDMVKYVVCCYHCDDLRLYDWESFDDLDLAIDLVHERVSTFNNVQLLTFKTEFEYEKFLSTVF